MRSVGQNRIAHGALLWGAMWLGVVAIVLTMAIVLGTGHMAVAAAETYGVNCILDGWTYDGTMHQVYSVAEDYEGAYTVTYYAVENGQVQEQVAEIVNAGQYVVEIVAEADDNYDACEGLTVPITVAKRALKVTALPASHVYGNKPSALQATHEGLVEGDEVPYSLYCDVTKRSAVGTYDIGYTDEGNRNYDITLYGEDAYTVTPRAVTVRADDKLVTYGDNALYLTATVTEGSILSGDKVYTLECIAGGKAPNARTHAGEYPIVVNDLENANYQLTAVNGTYSVAKYAAVVAILPSSSAYGEAPTAPRADESQILHGDREVYALQVAVTERSAVGAYDVVGQALNADYDLTFEGGEGAYTVTPRILEVAWGETQFVYDGTPHLPTIALSNIVYDDVVSATVVGTATDAGVYTADATEVSNPNYALPTNAHVGFCIWKAEATFDLSQVQTVFSYTGEVQSIAGAVTSGETTYRNNEFCEMGTYDVVIESGESENYRWGSAVVTVTVREAAPIVDQASGAAVYYKQIDRQTAAKQGVIVSGIFNDAFADLTASSVSVVIHVGEASITFDRAAVEAAAGYEVRMTYRETSEIAEELPQDALAMIDLDLDGATLGKGKATIKQPLAYKAGKNELVKVYYVSDEGEMVDMHADLQEGVLTFDTDQLGRYLVVAEVKLAKSTVTGIVLGSIACGLALMVAVLLWIRRKTVRAAKESLEE